MHSPDRLLECLLGGQLLQVIAGYGSGSTGRSSRV